MLSFFFFLAIIKLIQRRHKNPSQGRRSTPSSICSEGKKCRFQESPEDIRSQLSRNYPSCRPGQYLLVIQLRFADPDVSKIHYDPGIYDLVFSSLYRSFPVRLCLLCLEPLVHRLIRWHIKLFSICVYLFSSKLVLFDAHTNRAKDTSVKRCQRLSDTKKLKQ